MGNTVVLGWAVASRIFPHPGSFLYLLVSLAVFAAGQGHGGGRSGEASGTRAETLCAKWWVLATFPLGHHAELLGLERVLTGPHFIPGECKVERQEVSRSRVHS